MAVALADEFGSVPKSPNLSASLERATVYAEEQGQRRITPEHLMLALSEDPDAGAILRALRVDIDTVRNEVAGLVGRDDDRFPLDTAGRPQISEDLQRILDAAAAAAGSKHRVLDGSLVLAALIGDGRSAAAEVLRQQGVTFEAVVQSLREAKPRVASKPVERPVAASSAASEAGEEAPVELTPRTRTQRPLPAAPTSPPAPQLPPRPAPGAALPRRPARLPPEMPWQRDPSQGAPGQTPQGYDDHGTPEEDLIPYGVPQPGYPEAAPAPYGAEGYSYDEAGAQPRRVPPQQAPARRQRVAPGAPPQAPAQPQSGRPRSGGRPKRKAKGVEQGMLIENIPRRMRHAVPELIEARIGRREVEALNDGLLGRGQPVQHEIFVTRAMSVRLRAPDGGFNIEAMSPETQWIENSLGLMEDDFASWRWSVEPLKRGRLRLQLVVSARSVGTDGVSAETAMPEQVVEVKVRTNIARAGSRAALWLGAAALTGAVGAFGEHTLRVIGRLLGQ